MAAVQVRSQKGFNETHRLLFENSVKGIQTLLTYENSVVGEDAWELLTAIQEYLWIVKIGEHVHAMALSVNGAIIYLDIEGEDALIFQDTTIDEFQWILPGPLYTLFLEQTEPYLALPLNFTEIDDLVVVQEEEEEVSQ